ncbi:MAG: glycosyltransferase family 2 protein [Prolixibacteraceae bacterium]
MSFARHYIQQHIEVPALIDPGPSPDLGIVVVIPSCDEPELLKTIESLYCCKPAGCGVEVIVVINEAQDCPVEICSQNERTMFLLEDWKQENRGAFFALYPLHLNPFPKKHAGVGLARKTGMDEAVRRFDWLNKPDGVIVSLDADTLVEPNYLTAIEKLFYFERCPVGTTIRFEHRTGEIKDEVQREGMVLYEAYLHYYKEALAYSGYPHAIYTIGSAFAVRADAYVRQGGMSRRQAGEDFYFLHKLTQLGKLAELNTTCVYPSARVSARVPFGTGAALQKWVKGDDRLRQTYNFRSFADLKNFFDLATFLYPVDRYDPEAWGISEPVSRFLENDHFGEALHQIRQNSSSPGAFAKRFFQYFNAFKVLKFLNFTHTRFYEYQDLYLAWSDLKAAQA